MHLKSCPKIYLISLLHDYIRKKYVTCILFAYQGIIMKKIEKKNFFWIFKIFHFWSNLYTQNHDQQFVSCLDFMIIYEKSKWHACPLHTKAYEKSSLWLDTLYVGIHNIQYFVAEMVAALLLLPRSSSSKYNKLPRGMWLFTYDVNCVIH